MSFGGFGATGGGFGASSGFGATSSGFGSNAAASPFGGGAATTTGGFGAPSAFGAATGTTSAFGAKPATSAFGGGGFGATTQAATGTGGGMFGAQPTTGFGAAPASGFGAAATPATGFGAAAPTTGFGASGTTGGAFGSSGFGATSGSTGFGGTSGFGSNAAASPFGAKSAAASPFGQSSVFGATAQPATSAFGSTTSSGFGASGGFGTPAPAANSGGMFGGGTSAFGAKSPFGGGATSTGFGAPAATGGFGAAPQQQQPQVGTGNPPYQVTRETDTTGMTNYVSISRMGAYAHKSTEELRYEDYLKQKNPAEAAAVAALNAPQQAQVGFGAATAQPTSSAFGGSSGFGAGTGFGTATTAPAAATGNAFGSSFGATGGATTSSFGGFGNQQSTGGLFGNTTRSVGGFSPAVSQPMGTGGAFGAPATPGAFGSTAPATGGFGTTTGGFGSSFGATVAPTAQPQSGFGFGSGASGSTGGFGASSFTKPTASTGFGFGATPSATPAATGTGGGFSFGGGAGATQPGATTSMFGSAAAPSTNSAFSFGGNTAKPATSSGFGFGGSSATGGFGTGGGFGSATTTGATGGLFGATTATQPTSTSLFGATGATGTTGAATGSFGFGNTSTTGTGSSLFGAAKTGSSLFNSTPATPTTGSLFGAPSGGSSMFGGTTTASKTSGGFSFGGGLGSTAPSTGGFGGGFGSFGSTTPSATGQTALGGTSMFGASATTTPSISVVPAQPQSLVAAPDVNPYGAGAFGAGLVEQNVKAALDQQSLKPSSSALRASSFAQDVGLPRGALENPVATRRNLLNSGYSVPVSFIRGSTFKGSKGRFSSITSSSAGTPSALRPSSEPSNGSQEDEFKFSSSLFRNSVAKRLVIEKSDRRQDASSRTNGARASVIPFTEEDSTPMSASTHSRPLRPDDDGNYTVVFRNLANKKSFSLQVKGSQTAKEAKEEVKSVLRATMKTGIRDIQLLSNGRIIVDNLAIADMRLKDGDVIDVAVVEVIDDIDGRGFNASKSQTDASDDGGKASKSARFMSYADFMNSAMREEDSTTDLSAPVSPSCPSLKNEDYFTSPSYDRLKRMTDRELAEIDSFTVGCKGLGSVEWIGKTDVRHLDLDALIQFEKKEVIVYKDDENKHELGTGLNRPAVVELLGIFPPRKAQDPEMYKEKVKQRTADIGATYIDYSPAKGIWRFRVEHFSRYGLDEDDDDDVDMDATDGKRLSSGEAPASLRLGDEKKMSAPKRMQVSRSVASDRVSIVRNSLMYGGHFASRSTVASFSEGEAVTHSIADEVLTEQQHPACALVYCEDDFDDTPSPVAPHVPTSIVYSLPPIYGIQPLGIDTDTSLLPPPSLSTTYQMFLRATGQIGAAKNNVDSGIFMARSFRCSWGPNGELVNLATSITSPAQDYSVATSGRRVLIEFPMKLSTRKPLTVQALDLHYECTSASREEEVGDAVDGTSFAYALPSGDGIVSCLHKFVEFADYAHKSNPSSSHSRRTGLLWKLIRALWGQEHGGSSFNEGQYCTLAARDDPREIDSLETYQMVDMRREAISRWMEDALLSELQELGVYDSSVPSQAGVLKLLIQHRIVEAAEMAMECGDFRLSSLISQASTYEGSDFRALLVDQLSQWSENGTLEYVNEEVIMIYSLLAGSVEVLTAQKASELSWIMCLALFFWYKRGPSTSLKTALSMYQDAVAKRLANGPSSTFAPSSNKMDVLMEVMKLYVDDAGSLCSVLSPSGFAGGRDAHLDYELSWQLNSVLRALGYKIDLQWESHIHQNFIRQLEGAGLWEQAIYVSLNISDAIERTLTCRQLLLRNADMLSKAASKRVELCDRFMIPMEWIEEALAVAAVAKHDYRQEIAHWIAAQCFQEAHACLIRRVAPICLFTGEKMVLSQVLAELEPHAHEIPEWNSCGEDYLIGGGLVLEYLRLESQDALETGGEEDFLVRLLQLSDQLSHSREVSTNGTRKQKAEPSELLVARTALSSMLVTLSTLSIQLRSALAAGSQDEESEEASAPQLDPSFLSSLAALTRGRETKFVETYRTQQLLSLCSAFVEMRA